MNFIANPDANIDGTSFHGVTIRIDYSDLVKILGNPHSEGDGKVQYEWFFHSDNGRVVTLYDWESSGPKPKIWNVGGLIKEDTESFKSWFNRIGIE